jgi:hypothetical protein
VAQQDVGVLQGLVGVLRQGVDGVEGVEEFSGEGGGVGGGVEGEERTRCGAWPLSGGALSLLWRVRARVRLGVDGWEWGVGGSSRRASCW